MAESKKPQRGDVVKAKPIMRPNFNVAKGDILPLGNGGVRVKVSSVSVNWREGGKGMRLRIVIEGTQT